MIKIVSAAMVVSWALCFALILFKHVHEHFSSDFVDSGPQKMHHGATPRIGGFPLFIGLLAGIWVLAFGKWNYACLPFIITLLPVWIAGMIEDLTKRVTPLMRLIAAFCAALIGFWLLDARLTRIHISHSDQWLASYWLLSALVTMVAVGGITHAMNIIDGFNGLAGVVVAMILSALAYVSHEVGDTFLMGLCLALLGSTLGFLFWNYPRGRIFAGDGGAYLWGFMIAEISVMLVYRNPGVSPWFPLLLVIYPLWETVFSIYRRKFVRGLPVGLPDATHLHSLIYKRVVRRMMRSKEAKHMISRNARTSPYLWVLASFSIIPSVIFWHDTGWLLLFALLFIFIYGSCYSMIVHFQVRPWLVINNKPLPGTRNITT